MLETTDQCIQAGVVQVCPARFLCENTTASLRETCSMVETQRSIARCSRPQPTTRCVINTGMPSRCRGCVLGVRHTPHMGATQHPTAGTAQERGCASHNRRLRGSGGTLGSPANPADGVGSVNTDERESWSDTAPPLRMRNTIALPHLRQR